MFRKTCAPALVIVLSCVVSAQADDATSFVEPTLWTVGDLESTYQDWDFFTSNAGNLPDAGYVTNPAIGAMPTLSVLPPGFLSSSGNFYSFSDDYGIEAVLYNHGGAYGQGGYGPGVGTYVMVQIAATENPDFPYGVIPDTVRLLAPDGQPLPGGAPEDVLRTTLLFEGEVQSPFGIVVQQELLVEFYLPGYVGDFLLTMDLTVHCMFRQLRVDTRIMPPLGTLGDTDCDGDVDFDDIDPFVVALEGQAAYEAQFPDCNWLNADADGDGDVDFDDIDAFVALLEG